MADIIALKDTVTGTSFQPGTIEYFNPDVGQVATLDILYDYDSLRQTLDRDALSSNRETTLWRYRDLLPIAPDSPVPPLAVGWTALYQTPRLAQDLGIQQAWVKDDGANPTGSLKDRASTMVVAHALEKGVKVVSTASTGNAAAALAGVGASVNHTTIETIIFVPAAAPEAKIAQLLVYGATVILVEDSYDTAFDLCYEMCISENWYCRNTGINPYTSEGKKTVAYEIAEQLNWQAPDVVIVSVGDGSIISGVHKGFVELHKLGWIEHVPRLIGVQAAGSSPLVKAWQNNMAAVDMQAEEVHTIADSISAGLPRDRVKALRAVRETKGAFVAVSDEAIIQAIPTFARLTGVFAEPSTAAIYAGAKEALKQGYLQADERVIFISTGNGLKDVRRAQESVSGGLRVQPTLGAVRTALKNR
ncbi:MAG: threonine synthase [Anaerolineae bacterium]|nr:threonine synthase [Anaerolineae bacterium]